jgi:hypothetical protein
MEWLEIPELADLITLADKHNIKMGNKTREELFFELAQASPKDFPETFVYKREYSEKDLEELARKQEEPLKGVLCHQKLKRKVLEYISTNPRAFSGYSFGLKNNNCQLTFDKKVSCACGTEFVIQHEWTTSVKEGSKKKIEKCSERQCPVCKKNWVLLSN